MRAERMSGTASLGLAHRWFCSPERLHALHRTRTRAGLPTEYDRACLTIGAEESMRELQPRKPMMFGYYLRRNTPAATTRLPSSTACGPRSGEGKWRKKTGADRKSARAGEIGGELQHTQAIQCSVSLIPASEISARSFDSSTFSPLRGAIPPQ